jgi:hypothetical protein
MEAASTSETLVNFYQTTRRNNSEDSRLHNRHRKNLTALAITVHTQPLHQIRFVVSVLKQSESRFGLEGGFRNVRLSPRGPA